MAGLREAELERGISLVGPHRDDLVLALGPMPAKGYASHGESWSYALALRLASYELLRSDLGEDPVLVLDDVFAELDAGRRERLAELVAGAEQVLVTAAVAGRCARRRCPAAGSTCAPVRSAVPPDPDDRRADLSAPASRRPDADDRVRWCLHEPSTAGLTRTARARSRWRPARR